MTKLPHTHVFWFDHVSLKFRFGNYSLTEQRKKTRENRDRKIRKQRCVPYAVDRPDETGFRLYALVFPGRTRYKPRREFESSCVSNERHRSENFSFETRPRGNGRKRKPTDFTEIPKVYRTDKSDSANFRKFSRVFRARKNAENFVFENNTVWGKPPSARPTKRNKYSPKTLRVFTRNTRLVLSGKMAHDHNKICTFVAKELVSSTLYLCTHTKSVQRD